MSAVGRARHPLPRPRPTLVGRRAGVAALVLAGAVLAGAGCGGADGSVRSSISSTASHRMETALYRPGLEADVYVPERQGAVPLVVLIPGGGWLTADRSGLGPLAERLSADGMFVVNATYRAAEAGVVFPTPVEDVLCAIGFATDRAERAGRRPDPVIVLGHSSGAHLAALAALGAVDRAAGCAYPLVEPDGFAGLAGVYDISSSTGAVEPLLGAPPARAPEAWRQANALTWAANRPSLSILLVHGDADELVPVTFSTTFASSLEQTGHAVRVELVPRVGHHEIYRPEFVAAPLEAWIGSLTGAPA
jgi:acetyl esterase/lipase